VTASDAPAGPEHHETVIGPGLARQAARATAVHQLTRPKPLGVLVLESVLGLLFLFVGPWWIGLVLLLGVVVLVASQLVAVPKLARQLEANGYAPGSRLGVDYYDDRFDLVTPSAHNSMTYAEINRLRVVGDIAVLRRVGSSALFILPATVVPPSVRPRFATAR
jgi:hypothetical protein